MARKWLAISILLLLQIIGIVRNHLSHYDNYFWFCDFAPTVFAVAFLIDKDHLAKGMVNIGLLAQVGYLLGFTYYVFTGVRLLALPVKMTPFYATSSFLLHTSTIVAFASTYKIRPTLQTLSYSLFCLVAICTTTILFTNPAAGINYVSEPGKITFLDTPNYTSLWVPLIFAAIVLPTQGIQYLFYRKASKIHSPI